MLKHKDICIFGFALFAMFFGAGNLIFPPLVGINTGVNWFLPTIGFLATAVGLPLLGVIAFTRKGSLELFASDVSPIFNTIFVSVLILVIGPFFALPRTGSTTYEMAIIPIVSEGTLLLSIISSVIFFGVTYFLTIKESKITDIIGRYLTPIILVILVIIFIRGLSIDMGTPVETKIVSNLFSYGFIQGYQTMDALGSILFAIVIVHNLKSKGVTDKKEQQKYLIIAGIIASLGLGFIYVFLVYFGALLSGMGEVSTSSSAVQIAELTLGSFGRVVFGICVGAACLTTAVGLTALTADWFARLTKLSYKTLVLIVCLFATVVAVAGLDIIVSLAVPVLLFLYPITIVLIIMNCFSMRAIFFKFGTYTTVLMATIETLASVFNIVIFKDFIQSIPLGKDGFVWIIPFIISLILVFIIEKTTTAKAE